MTSKIEQLIDEIEEYVESCKPVPLSAGKVIVNKEEFDELIGELRKHTPEELKQIRKIINNKDAILEDAKAKAEALVNDAAVRTSQLLSENQIMQQAYSEADAIIMKASQEAQMILDNATMESNQLREAAIAYMDNMMAEMERIFESAMESNNSRYQEVQNSLNHYYQIVQANRQELHPATPVEAAPEPQPSVTEPISVDTGEINLDMM